VTSGAPRPALEALGLARRYGELTAVADFSLVVPPGSVYGLIGPNGAGKTTSLRMLATLLPPSAGEAWIGGASVIRDPRGARRQLGYMPDFFGVYPELKVAEYLDFYAACHDVPTDERPRVIADLLDLVELSSKKDGYVEGLSRGMQQRLGLARALVHDPSVLLLDEPASGLDPRARMELREVVRELGKMGKAVVISSHILAELADLCTHVAIMDGGRIVIEGEIEAVTRRLNGGRGVRVDTLGETSRLRDLLAADRRVQAVSIVEGDPETEREPIRSAIRFVFDGDEAALRELLASVIRADLPVYSFAQETTDLEDVFMRLTERVGSRQ
jgi:ABC-2 type transport system ATP-binding protein